jgi:hypothetical protein
MFLIFVCVFIVIPVISEDLLICILNVVMEGEMQTVRLSVTLELAIVTFNLPSLTKVQPRTKQIHRTPSSRIIQNFKMMIAEHQSKHGL